MAKVIAIAIAFIVAAFFAYKKLLYKPPPAPPVVIEAPPEPPPLISPQEEARVAKSAEDMDPLVRMEAIILLDKLKARSAYPIMFERLHKDDDTALRIKIITLLETRKTPEIAPNLVAVTRDLGSDPSVRVAALTALAKVGDLTTASAVADALKDHDESVRKQALKTLNALQDLREAQAQAARQMAEELRRQAEEAAKNK